MPPTLMRVSTRGSSMSRSAGFTRRAAREMMSRLESLVGPSAAKVWAGTFHHIGNRILRRSAATLGFVVFGWGAEGRPPLSLGYVNVPAAVAMGLLTTLVAPYGARLAHRLDKTLLRRVFAVYMLLTAISVIVKAF